DAECHGTACGNGLVLWLTGDRGWRSRIKRRSTISVVRSDCVQVRDVAVHDGDDVFPGLVRMAKTQRMAKFVDRKTSEIVQPADGRRLAQGTTIRIPLQCRVKHGISFRASSADPPGRSYRQNPLPKCLSVDRGREKCLINSVSAYPRTGAQRERGEFY